MSIKTGSNISSLIAQRSLINSTKEVSTAQERLASGMRINRASDDAAGLAIASSLETDSILARQGIRNLNDGISLLNIATGAMQELSSITSRLSELSTQAATGTLSSTQRETLDLEAQALAEEYNRVARSTEFNGRSLFDSDFGTLTLESGLGDSSSISSNLGGAVGDGSFSSSSEVSYNANGSPMQGGVADFNNDGYLDVVQVGNSGAIYFEGSGNGTLSAGTTIGSVGAASGGAPVTVADFNSDGFADFAFYNNSSNVLYSFLGNGDGTFAEAPSMDMSSYSPGGNVATGVASADMNGDGITDLVLADASTDIHLLSGNGNGSFSYEKAVSVGTSVGVHIKIGDFNDDGYNDIVGADSGNGVLFLHTNDGTGSFQETTYTTNGTASNLTVSDFNNDGIDDVAIASDASNNIGVLLGNQSGSFDAVSVYAAGTDPMDITAGDYNGDGIVDLATANYNETVSIFIGTGGGSFAAKTDYDIAGTDPSAITSADFNSDGVTDLLLVNRTSDTLEILTGDTTTGISALQPFSLKEQYTAKYAMEEFSRVQERLSLQQGTIGAFESRLEIATNNLSAANLNFEAAESRIRDADVAQEAANLVRAQILQQASVAVLAQANQQPALALSLLGVDT